MHVCLHHHRTRILCSVFLHVCVYVSMSGMPNALTVSENHAYWCAAYSCIYTQHVYVCVCVHMCICMYMYICISTHIRHTSIYVDNTCAYMNAHTCWFMHALSWFIQWQFHFSFDLKKDIWAQDSIDMLRKVSSYVVLNESCIYMYVHLHTYENAYVWKCIRRHEYVYVYMGTWFHWYAAKSG